MKRVLILGLMVGAMGLVGGCNCDKKSSDAKPASAVAPAPRVLKVGEPMKLTGTDAVSVTKVLAAPAEYQKGPVRVAGRIESVCEVKGCWIRMESPSAAPGGETLFVKFTCPSEPNGRIVPIEAKGQTAVVEGVVKVKEITEEDARHYAEDAGKTPAEIEKIKGPQKMVTISSPSVEIVMK